MNFKFAVFPKKFTLYYACIVASILQVLLGAAIWGAYAYWRPMVEVTHIVIMAYFFVGAAFGLYSTWKQSCPMTWIYLLQLSSCLAIAYLITMDLLEILPIFPVMPQIKTSITRIQKLEQKPAASAYVHSTKSLLPTPLMEKASFSRHPLLKYSRHQNVALDSFTTPTKSSQLEADASDLAPNAVIIPSSLVAKRDTSAHSEGQFAVANPPALAKVASPTEGQSEEVSRDELPPEVPQLPKNMQQQVSATTKVIKHVIKFFFSGIFATVFILQVYCSYIVFTFVLNKCTSLDELTEQPEQFEPILQAESSDTVFSQISAVP